MAVGLQRAHAEVGGQGEGLAVVGCGEINLQGLAPGGNVAQQSQDPRLVSPFLVGPGEFERLLGKGQRLLRAAGQQRGFALISDPERPPVLSARCGGLLYRLLQQRQGLSDPSGQGIRLT